MTELVIQEKPIGFFTWYKMNGKISCAKTEREIYEAAMSKTADGYTWRRDFFIQSWPLGPNEWWLNLDALALKYPCPPIIMD